MILVTLEADIIPTLKLSYLNLVRTVCQPKTHRFRVAAQVQPGFSNNLGALM